MPRQHVDPIASGLAAVLLACASPSAGAAPQRDPGEAGAVEISLDQAVMMALTNSRALSVARLAPEIQRTFEEEQRAAFDPVLSAEGSTARVQPTPSSTSTNAALSETRRRSGGALGLAERLPTGTELGLNLATERVRGSGSDEQYATRAEISATQPLLQGRPRAVNLVSLRQARVDTEISEFELRGFAETLVADVENAYWECVLARRQVQILEESLTLAEKQLEEIEHRIRVGDLAETELSAAQAETALRREALINARSGLATARLRLLRLVNPKALGGPRSSLLLKTEPAVPETRLESLESHVAAAMQMRPDLNQARLALRRNELELLRTRNGLLPRMDLFIQLGDTGYARSFADSAREIDGREIDVSAGVTLAFPVFNRAAKARHRRVLFTREQAEEALRNLGDLVRVDVESGYIEVERTKEQVAATAITRKFQEEKLRAETAKLNVGRSTALLVAQAQRDLVASQVSEVDAVIRHLEALVALYRLDGSLLDRRGLAVARPATTD